MRAPIAHAQRFAGYELEELVAESGMGVVYRARDVRLEREVALRIIGSDVARDPVIRARLNRESTVLASVDHPNVVPIYEAREDDGRLIIVTRWVAGVGLGELVREHGPLEPRRAVRIVNQVASAIQAAHGLGIMHRNVKPSSVLVTETDHAYLTDFGLARRSSDLTGLTMQEQLVESFDYLAPEYVEGRPVDARVDIYGLGCVLCEALTAEVPYPAETPAAKMYAHRSAEPPSIRARVPDLPEALDAVVKRAMAKDPSDRYQTPAELAVEASGAIAMSAPLWAEKPPVSSSLLDEGTGDAEAVPAPAPPAEASEPVASAAEEDWSEPAYFAQPGPSRGRRLGVAVALLVFVAAPIALVLAVVLQ